MDTTDTLQEGMVAPAGVTASEPKTGKDFSRTPIPTAQRTGADQPDRRPPPCAIAVAPPPTPPHCEHHHEAKRPEEKRQTPEAAAPLPSRRDPPPPPTCGRPEPPAPSRSPAGRGSRAHQATPGPARPKRARKAPPAMLQQAGTCAARSQPSTPLSRLLEATPPARPAAGPPKPRWAPRGPYLGRKGAAASRRGSPQQSDSATASSPLGAMPPEAVRCRRNRRAPVTGKDHPQLPGTRSWTPAAALAAWGSDCLDLGPPPERCRSVPMRARPHAAAAAQPRASSPQRPTPAPRLQDDAAAHVEDRVRGGREAPAAPSDGGEEEGDEGGRGLVRCF